MSTRGNVILLLIGALLGGLFLSAITSPNTFDLATFIFGAVCDADEEDWT